MPFLIVKEHKIKVDKTARYFLSAEPTPAIRSLWIVIHGYGQLAEYFIQKFTVLANEHTLIAAPEGLSRYYLKDSSGRVGASWMTKENREDEIEDQLAYLNTLYHALKEKIGNPQLKLNLLGFSQGVATVFRWYAQSEIKVENLVFWAGSLPDEKVEKDTSATAVYFLYGKRDEFLHWINEEKQRLILMENFSDYHIDVFDGTHEVNSIVLRQYAERFKWI